MTGYVFRVTVPDTLTDSLCFIFTVKRCKKKQPRRDICVYDTGMDAGVRRTMWVARLNLSLDALALKTTALRSIETPPTTNTTTQCNITEDLSLRVQVTPWSRVPLEKLTVSQLVKKFPAFYGTRRFITAFTRARHLSLSRVQVI
jgi:hypothetical protein